MRCSSEPRVSVVIPAYNAQDFIAETLESALNQSFRAFEIIVVDDGSCDGTHAIVDKYCNRGVTLLTQPNAGIGAARNRALSVAQSKLIALLDSDDLWEPDYLHTMVGFLDRNPEVSIAFSDQLFFGKSKFSGRRYQEVYPPSPPITFAKLAGGISNVSISATLRRDVFARVGLFEQGEAIRGGEDFDLWLRALHAGCRIEPVPCVLARYRRHVDSLSSSTPMEKAALYALGKWRGEKSLTAPEREAVETAYLRIRSYLDVREAISHIHTGDYALALAALRRACEYNPKWRYRAARLGLAVWPGLTRVALRGMN